MMKLTPKQKQKIWEARFKKTASLVALLIQVLIGSI
jgi:hypothetical protein